MVAGILARQLNRTGLRRILWNEHLPEQRQAHTLKMSERDKEICRCRLLP